MTRKSEIGKLGEDIACEYLVSKGYKICERNFRKPWGEIDVVAKDPEGILAFVEVKTIRQFGNAAILPEDNLTKSKLKRVRRISYMYANGNPELITDEKGWRIDLIAITIPEAVAAEGLTELLKCCEIKHFENIN